MSRTPHRRALGVLAVCAALLTAGCSDDEVPPSVTPPASATQASPTPTVTTPTPSGSATPSASPTATPPPADGPTVAEVYRDVRTSALSAGSGHATGTQTRDGRRLRIDVEGVANGSNQTVFITTPAGGTPEVRTVSGRYWLGGDEAFWVEQTGDPKAGADMVGKYVEISESDATELGSFTLRSILTEKFGLAEFASLESDRSAAERTSLRGTDAWLLTGKAGARLWVAADGSAALLRAVGPKSAPSDLSFTDWDRAQRTRQPTADQVVTNE
ncbi:hypothetical protein [Oryzobacter terrae]|uniref:hypothetical protein n=1 Tax=Oryzobacter terrae TaxID=1620385 RepID=UPI00366A82D6